MLSRSLRQSAVPVLIKYLNSRILYLKSVEIDNMGQSNILYNQAHLS